MKVTIEIDSETVEEVLEFAQLNLDCLNVEEFKDVQESVCAIYKAFYAAKHEAYTAKREAFNAPS